MSSGLLLAPTQAPARATSPAAADLAFASGDTLLLATRGESLDLPAPADAGAERVAALALDAAAGDLGALVAGVVPFDPALPPDLFVVRDPLRVPVVRPDRPVREAAPQYLTPEDEAARTSDPAFRGMVRDALDRVASDELTKVVLARHWDLPVVAGEPDLDLVWERLLAGNPSGYTFAVRQPGRTFLGASPELVAQVDDAGFATHPLAGSTPRSGDAERDRRAGAALLTSEKDLREHRHVVDHIVARLALLVARLDVPARPSVFATDTMLHLGTRLTGRLRPTTSSLHAALAIHPTPAVCGVPAAAALASIRELEATPRGSYAGLVGWMNGRGHGQWAYALRCASVSSTTARLFAGAGIVAGSTPEAEEAETAAKFATAADALASLTRSGARA